MPAKPVAAVTKRNIVTSWAGGTGAAAVSDGKKLTGAAQTGAAHAWPAAIAVASFVHEALFVPRFDRQRLPTRRRQAHRSASSAPAAVSAAEGSAAVS